MTIIGDHEANKLLTREYRKPFVVPKLGGPLSTAIRLSAVGEDFFDHVHILERVLEGHGNFRVLEDGAREQFALNRVLIADRKFFHFIVYENTRRLVRRRVERNFDFNPSRGPEDVHLLIGNQLRGAGEAGVASRIFEDHGRQPVGLELGVAIEESVDARAARHRKSCAIE